MTEELTRAIADNDVEWLYETNDKKENVFERDQALALMLINNVIFTNSHWYEDDWPQRAKDSIGVVVDCSDVFAWGCADGQDLPFDEIENLYRMWRKGPRWGPAVWCMIQRNQMPQPPVEDAIRKEGIWQLDQFNLGKNTMDAEVKECLRRVLSGETPMTEGG
jgi:hypothetical protein